MRWGSFILLTASLTGLACNSTGKKPTAPSQPSGSKEGGAFWSEDRASRPNDFRAPPPKEGDGLLAGTLIDSYGNPPVNAVVNVTPIDGAANAKPIGVQADEHGFFIIKGLNSGTTYQLSVRGEDRGRVLGGTAITQAPNARVLIRMNDANVPATVQPPQPASGSPAVKKDEPKAKLSEPKMSIPAPEPAPAGRDPLTGADQSWGPGKPPPASTPMPPPPATGSPNPNVAETVKAWPPAASIPGPGTGFEPPPPAAASSSMSAVPSNSSPLTAGPSTQQLQPQINFTLSDVNGNPVEFRNLTDRRLVVLDFWSTTCMPCLRKIPDLIELQGRYATYVEVVGIACDDLPFAQRGKAVEGVKDYYLRKTPRPINYGVLYEPEGAEGRVQTQFKIRSYPTMILLDHAGRELWRGSDTRQLEDSIKYYLMRR